MKKGVIIGIVSGLMLTSSMWVPAFERYGIGVSFMEVPDLAELSWTIAILGVVMAFIAFLNKKATDILGIVLSSLALIFSALFMSVALTEEGASFGVFLMFIGSAGALVGFIVNLITRKKQPSLNA